jgi:hypothetical protein
MLEMWEGQKKSTTTNNYLEVMVHDEEATLEQLNRLCGVKHDVFSRARIPRQCLLVEATNEVVVNDQETGQFDNN